MRRVASAATLAIGVVPVLALGHAAAGPAGEVDASRDAIASREALRAFDEYPLFDVGERVDGLPLAAVLRRDDTAEYVSFVYGDCVPEGDAGCPPPAEVQVWPACRRNLDLYESPAIAERIVVRGVAGGLFDDGTRLEVETGRATIVVFGETRSRVQRMARALRALDGSVPAGAPLPPPARRGIGGAIDC